MKWKEVQTKNVEEGIESLVIKQKLNMAIQHYKNMYSVFWRFERIKNIGYSAVSTQEKVVMYVLSTEVFGSIDDVCRVRYDEFAVRLSYSSMCKMIILD